MFCLNSFGKLGAIVRSAFADPDAVIKALFASGEQGAWYDPSDLTTMFRDRAGKTPVTADGQTVGLILDKSKGLVLGPELVTNGDFSNGTTGWGYHAAFPPQTFSNVSGTLNVANDGVARALFGQSTYDSIVTGKGYKIILTVRVNSGNLPGINFSVAPYDIPLVVFNSGGEGVGTYTFTAIYSSTITGSAHINFDSYTAFNISVIGASVKEIAGNHAVAPSDAARPLYKVTGLAKWNDFDAVDDVLNTTFPSSLGSSCTVARANVGGAPTILTGQTIGTSYANSTDNAGLIIINRALTAQETTDVTAWLLAKGATS